MLPTRVRPPLRRCTAPVDLLEDHGFAVLEALVSFVILLIVSGTVFDLISHINSGAKDVRARVNATYLAQQDLQVARSVRYPAYPMPAAQKTAQVGRTKYQITRTVSSPCPPNPDHNPDYYSAHSFMLVTTTVTWDLRRDNSIPPGHAVRLSTEWAC